MTLSGELPKISIGVPVYNGAATIDQVLTSILSQTLKELEVIISDNASTDGTAEICQKFASTDGRVKYVRQATNIGSGANFEFVMNAARSPLFMWAASDDLRSDNFLMQSSLLLDEHPEAVTATSMVRLDSETDDQRLATPLAEAHAHERIVKFLDVCWRSHALFYGVHRLEHLKTYAGFQDGFVASDWALVSHMAIQGKMLVSEHSLMIVGTSGLSNSSRKWSALRRSRIEFLVPLYQYSRRLVRWTRRFPANAQVQIALRLAKLNASALYDQIFNWAYGFYRTHLRALVRGR